jgi:arylsulfatase A-like enzyme
VHDLVLRLDRSVEAFLKTLNKRFKAGEVTLVFTADHGAVPAPEWSSEHHIEAVRLKKATIKDVLNKALSARFGAGEWVLALEDPSVYLNYGLISQNKLDRAFVEQVAADAALTLPGVLGVHTRTQLLHGMLPQTALARAVTLSFSPTRSGDLVVVQAPFSFWGKYAEKDVGSTHGSAFHYDTDVPVIFTGKPFQPGFFGSASVVDIAATLARTLGLTPPAACEGKSLDRALR